MENLLAYLDLIEKLKLTPRTGWIRSGLPREHVESISDHMYRMAMLSMLLPSEMVLFQDSGSNSTTDADASRVVVIDRQRCIRMSLCHDLAESIVGDITPYDGVTKEDKAQREEVLRISAMQEIRQLLLGASQVHVPTQVADEILALWLEYEQHETPESMVVHDLDKWEMVVQAWEYEQRYPAVSLDSFFESTQRSGWHSQLMRDWDRELREKRLAWKLKS